MFNYYWRWFQMGEEQDKNQLANKTVFPASEWAWAERDYTVHSAKNLRRDNFKIPPSPPFSLLLLLLTLLIKLITLKSVRKKICVASRFNVSYHQSLVCRDQWNFVFHENRKHSSEEPTLTPVFTNGNQPKKWNRKISLSKSPTYRCGTVWKQIRQQAPLEKQKWCLM
jgi:hypothetical protein